MNLLAFAVVLYSTALLNTLSFLMSIIHPPGHLASEEAQCSAFTLLSKANLQDHRSPQRLQGFLITLYFQRNPHHLAS